MILRCANECCTYFAANWCDVYNFIIACGVLRTFGKRLNWSPPHPIPPGILNPPLHCGHWKPLPSTWKRTQITKPDLIVEAMWIQWTYQREWCMVQVRKFTRGRMYWITRYNESLKNRMVSDNKRLSQYFMTPDPGLGSLNVENVFKISWKTPLPPIQPQNTTDPNRPPRCQTFDNSNGIEFFNDSWDWGLILISPSPLRLKMSGEMKSIKWKRYRCYVTNCCCNDIFWYRKVKHFDLWME